MVAWRAPGLGDHRGHGCCRIHRPPGTDIGHRRAGLTHGPTDAESTPRKPVLDSVWTLLKNDQNRTQRPLAAV